MDTFVARQPIYDDQNKVFAYELFFRSGFGNIFEHQDPEQASIQVISDSLHLIGLDILTMGKKAFINFPESLLQKEYVSILPTEDIVIEILEDVKPTEETLNACRRLKKKGFLMALDDFVHGEEANPLIEVSDFVKIDFKATPPAERKKIAKELLKQGKFLIAEKIETVEEYIEAKASGFHYFQGYYFCKPTIISRKSIPSYKLNLMAVFKEIFKKEIDYARMENLLTQEVSLSYKLLRYINSSYFGHFSNIKSIKQAMVLLGSEHFRQWVSLVILTDIGQDKPNEVVVNAIIRGRFCKVLAEKSHIRNRSEDLFMLGMFSIIDVLVGRPLSDILSEIPLDHDIKDALLGIGNPLRDIFEMTLSYEKQDWERLSSFAAKSGTHENSIPELYVQSVEWANNIFYKS